MDWSEVEPEKKKPKLKNLEEMSISALDEYIEGLKTEILRAENMIKDKKVARDGANSVFKR